MKQEQQSFLNVLKARSEQHKKEQQSFLNVLKTKSGYKKYRVNHLKEKKSDVGCEYDEKHLENFLKEEMRKKLEVDIERYIKREFETMPKKEKNIVNEIRRLSKVGVVITPRDFEDPFDITSNISTYPSEIEPNITFGDQFIFDISRDINKKK